MLLDWESDTAEIPHGAFGVTLVNNVSFHHNDQFIELVEDLGGGLVDGRNNCSARFCDLVQELHKMKRCGGVETSGGFIKEDNGRVSEKLDTN